MCVTNITKDYHVFEKRVWKVVFKGNQPVNPWARKVGFTIENPNRILPFPLINFNVRYKIFDGGLSCYLTRKEAKLFLKHVKKNYRDWGFTKWTRHRLSVRSLVVQGRMIHGSCSGLKEQQIVAEKFLRWYFPLALCPFSC